MGHRHDLALGKGPDIFGGIALFQLSEPEYVWFKHQRGGDLGQKTSPAAAVQDQSRKVLTRPILEDFPGHA